MSDPSESSPPAWTPGIFAITLFVEDLAAARDVYGRVFGLPEVFADANSAVLRFGDTLVNLLDVAAAPELVAPAVIAPPTAGARMVLTVQVDDVDAWCARLQARGVPLLNGPMDRPWGPRTASFQGPGGHIWELAR